MDFLETAYAGNTIRQYLIAVGIAAGMMIGVRIIKVVATRKLQPLAGRTASRLDDLGVSLIRRTKLLVSLLVAVYVGSLSLASIHPAVTAGLRTAALLAVLVQVGIWGGHAIGFLVTDYRTQKLEKEDTNSLATVGILAVVGRMVLWAVIVLVFLDNLGVDVTALVAGLGIGGIAVALAVQNVLGDLLASVSIALDKPFVAGDFIIVGSEMGTVERVGLKTTRVRSLSGEQLVFSNSDLLSSRIRNYKRMAHRRIEFSVGVTYQTQTSKVEQIPEWIREAIESRDNVTFDRAHFKSFGDSALVFEAVYNMQVPDYNVYMDTQQQINMALMRQFEKEGVEFAYPTQTVFVSKVA